MTEAEIYAEMLAVFEKRTGYHMQTEADLAVRLYAAAAQIASLYSYADYVKRQAFPQTAVGDCLDQHATMRGFGRKAAVAATGYLRFSIPAARTDSLTIPKGSVCTTADLRGFETTEVAVLSAGQLTVDVAARAQTPGSGGNVAAGTITLLNAPPVGIGDCTNPAAFSGGADVESDGALRQRILDSYRSLPNGANAGYYRKLALSVDGVDTVKIIPRMNGIGTVGVVIAAAEGTASEAVVQEVQALMDENREIAVTVTVQAAEPLWLAVAMDVVPEEGASMREITAAMHAVFSAYFSGRLLGRTVYRTELIHLAMSTGLIQTVTIHMPLSDVVATEMQLPMLSSVKCEEA